MTKAKRNLRFMTLTAMLAAFLAILSPMTIPAGPIPITLATFALFLVASISPVSVSVTAVAVYLALGAVGLPVFSGFEGGLHKLVGVTGGFLVSYLPAAALVSFFVKRFGGKKWAFPVGMVLGLAVVYLFGAIWFAISYPATLGQAMTTAVIPFLLPDGIKIAAASVMGYILRKRFSSLLG